MSDQQTIILDVKGMTCQGCVNAVTRIIKRQDPQAQVSIDLASGKVEALSAVASQELAKAISAAGYEAQPR